MTQKFCAACGFPAATIIEYERGNAHHRADYCGRCASLLVRELRPLTDKAVRTFRWQMLWLSSPVGVQT